jgi:hypothetical protein
MFDKVETIVPKEIKILIKPFGAALAPEMIGFSGIPLMIHSAISFGETGPIIGRQQEKGGKR